MSSPPSSDAVKSTCPNCRKVLPSDERTGPFPFCSAQCKMLDLSRWFNEEYRISVPLSPEDMLELEAEEEASQNKVPH